MEYNYQNDDFGFTFIFQRKADLYNDKINDKINSLDKKIIELIRINKYITIVELTEKTGKSQPTIYRHIVQLSKLGLINRIGSRKTGYWEIANNID